MTGTAGIVADFDEMAFMTRAIDEVCGAIDDAVAACVTGSHDALVAVSTVVDPLRAGGIEWQLLEIRDGPSGLRLAGLELTTLRDVLSLAIAAYREADHLLDGAQDWITHHPGLVDDMINGITAVSGLSERQICSWLATFYPDGRPRVALVSSSRGDQPPRTVADIMAGLAARSDISDRWSPASDAAVGALPKGYDDGTIDVRRITGPEGVAWVVDLPGTSRWDLPGPGADPASEHDPADFGGDIRLMAGESTVYERGVVEAVTSLPVRPGQPILLTGHSEGGLVAMAAAGALAARGLRVAGVLTAGSPIATMTAPRGTAVLALENTDDIVPHLDGAANPSGPDWTTLSFTDSLPGIAADHGFDAYAVGAADADRSTEPAVVRWRQRARPFLTGTAVRTWAFRIQREP